MRGICSSVHKKGELSEAYDAVSIAVNGLKYKERRGSALQHWQLPGIFKIRVMLEMSVLQCLKSAFIPPSPFTLRDDATSHFTRECFVPGPCPCEPRHKAAQRCGGG